MSAPDFAALRERLREAQAEIRRVNDARYRALSRYAAKSRAARWDYDELTAIYLAMRERATTAEARLEAVEALRREVERWTDDNGVAYTPENTWISLDALVAALAGSPATKEGTKQ